MKKIIIAFILALLFLINIVGAALIYLDIQALEFPQTTIRIDVIEINSDEIILRHDININNPNSFEMILQNVQIIATTPTGEEVTNITISGGAIAGQTNKSFTADDTITLKGNLSGLLTSTISGVVGVNILGLIKKTIPLEITIETSLEDALKKITLPAVAVRTEFGTITRHTIDLLAEVDVSNTNPFGFFFSDITVGITTETGDSVGNFTLHGTTIPAESQTTLHGNGSLRIQALNAKRLFVDLSAEAGITIAGINKTLPFTTSLEITLPDFSSFIPSDPPLELALKVDLQRAKGGLSGNMTLEIINPTKIPLIARDIAVEYYRVKNNVKTFIAEGLLGSGELSPQNQTLFQGDIMLPYSKLFNLSARSVLPDMIFAQLRANISLYGVNLSLPVALGSYIDLQPLRPSK